MWTAEAAIVPGIYAGSNGETADLTARRPSTAEAPPATRVAATPRSAPRATGDGIVSRMTPVMTIMGLEISSDVARRAQLGDLGWDTSSMLNLTHLNTAYGYISQLLVFLSVVLDVPVLYHVDLAGSCCRVQQMIPPSATTTALPRDVLDVCPPPPL